MNAVEIEEAVSDLAAQPFDRAEFPFAFLTAFGNKETTTRRLRTPSANASDVPGGVLQRNNIHLAACGAGDVEATLAALKASPKTAANRVKFVLATDGVELQAHDITADDPLTCPFPELARHFGFFLPLAGISAVRQIKENPIDVKATGRLNKLYVELLKDNPDWAGEAKRGELNRFMARLVFCFFAEDTGIFRDNLFSATVEQMSEARGAETNVHEVLAQLFLAMATPTQHQGAPDGRYRQAAGVRPYADAFPFVNGGLFEDGGEVPRFSRMARTYLLRTGELHWQHINPDIFGSMIQAVAEDEERGALGMHYTSVPNILKVLNPLFLDDLRAELEAADDSVRKLRALRRRIAAIRVFDPACGSGNFLVIAYIQMREIEREIVARTGDDPKSLIPLTNFYGIEIKSFAAEIARLALLIAEFQCDSRMISQQAARSMVLPLHQTGQVHVGNALQKDWLEVCPPAAPVVEEWDLGGPTGRLPLGEGLEANDRTPCETYIASNPPYKGRNKQSEDQKIDLAHAVQSSGIESRALDYVAGWIIKASEYIFRTGASCGLVCTNSVCQGEQVPIIWPEIFKRNQTIRFAHTSFTWSNLAASKAGVTVIVLGIGSNDNFGSTLFDGETSRAVTNISPYLTPGPNVIVEARRSPISDLPPLYLGSMAKDGGNLIMSSDAARRLVKDCGVNPSFLRDFWGSEEIIDNTPRKCLWIEDGERQSAFKNETLANLLDRVRAFRLSSPTPSTRKFADTPHRFVQISAVMGSVALVIPRVSSERREYLPVALVTGDPIVGDKCYAGYDPQPAHLSIIASRLHRTWIATVCSRLRTDFSYANTLGWNTFPIPYLTEQDKADLSACAEAILLAREAHFPATIADLYDPDAMPDNLRRAHERNDETLERIYIGRRFRNDTERLEHLFKRYTEMTASDAPPPHKGASKKTRKAA